MEKVEQFQQKWKILERDNRRARLGRLHFKAAVQSGRITNINRVARCKKKQTKKKTKPQDLCTFNTWEFQYGQLVLKQLKV